MEPTDQELWQTAARGDHAAFTALIDRHARSLFRVALSLSSSRSDAEDICQETFVAAYRGLKGFDGRASIKTWLTRILMRRAAKIWHKERHSRRSLSLSPRDGSGSGSSASQTGFVPSAEPSIGSATMTVDQRLDVMQVIRTLSPDHQEAVILREINGLSYQEIADVLGVPRGTVESRLYRARAELRLKLSGYRET